MERVEAEVGILRASEVHVVIEIVSPGSRRIDNIDKRGEYADAGIPWYWIIDRGTFTTNEPFPITIDLDRLV